MFEPYLQKSVMEIRSSLQLFNADVDLAMEIHKKTFDAGMTTEAFNDIRSALQPIYETLAIRAKRISELCAEILKHKDC